MSAPPDGPADEPVPPLDFDPYRFGKPDHPVPPEYAPPGYRPEPPAAPPPVPPLDFDPYRFGKPDHPIPPGYAPPGYHAPPPADWPPAPGNPPPPPPYPYRTNGKATTALVLGILAILFSWLSVWDLLLIVPALVLGIQARRDAARTPHRVGHASATAAIVCGIVAAVLVVALTVFAYYRVRPCLEQYGANSPQFETCATGRIFG